MKPTSSTHCYCNVTAKESSMIPCNKCKRHFHITCLRSGKPSPLEGDIFFTLICETCSYEGEKITRQPIPWLHVVTLTLYNLSHGSSGKSGYFRWKEHICSFIDRHWHVFFGSSRKKTQTWHGTVAGTLSQGCPSYFISGTIPLRESGWWKLANNKPPALDTLTHPKHSKRYRIEKDSVPVKVGGLRSRQNKTSIQAAIELRAKRDTLHEAKDIRIAQMKGKDSSTSPKCMQAPPPPVLLPLTKKTLEAFGDGSVRDKDDGLCSPDTSISEPPSCSTSRLGNHSFELASDMTDQSSQMSFSSTRSDMWFTDRDLMPGRDVPMLLLKEDEDEEDLEIDPCAISPFSTPSHDHTSSVLDSFPNVEDMMNQIGDHSASPASHAADDVTQSDSLSFRSLLEKIKQEPSFETPTPQMDIIEPELHSIKQEGDSSLMSYSMLTEQDDSMAGSSVCLSKDVSFNSLSQNPDPCCSQVEESMDISQEIKTEIKEEPDSSSTDSEDESPHETSQSALALPTNEVRERWKRNCETSQEKNPNQSLLPATVYEEKMLLNKIKSYGSGLNSNHKACRLKRKLLIRQTKRERGLPVFDLDAVVNQITGSKRDLYGIKGDMLGKDGMNRLNPTNVPMSRQAQGATCILDRYHYQNHNYQQQQHMSFRMRLVGTEDDQLQPIRSPYTSRTLKPFIRRDYETMPQKLKLLREIKSHALRNKPSTSCASSSSDDCDELPAQAPIDYCYVRPQHIPSVNALCREFFWPGIDVSECLQYPDFSCIVLYRKLVIGFAFMVPDVKYNEAYISFIFTHPEWRGAGIAQFMLYHLIQTCMGKDVTLHVSASNTAMLMYQKFGFKPEEFILDFYDKYYPAESKDSRHAFFLRLRR